METAAASGTKAASASDRVESPLVCNTDSGDAGPAGRQLAIRPARGGWCYISRALGAEASGQRTVLAAAPAVAQIPLPQRLPFPGEAADCEFRFGPYSALASPAEWTGEMWLAGAKFLLEVWRALLAENRTLRMPTPRVVHFQHTTPVFVHPCSIGMFREDAFHGEVRQFIRSFLVPIYMLTLGHGGLVRTMHRHLAPTVPLLNPAVVEIFRHYDALAQSMPPGEALAEFYAAIVGTRFAPTASRWVQYYCKDHDLYREEDWDYKKRMVARSLEIVRPATVLDIGSNTGWYSMLAARHGAEVCALDADEACASRLHARAATESASVLPLVMDIVDPTPALGITGQVPGAIERIRSAMVLALALSHHLSLGLGLSFQQIGRALADLSTRSLLTEFIPFTAEARNPYPADCRPELDQWYTLEHFTSALGAHFREVVVVPGPPGGRVLVACER